MMYSHDALYVSPTHEYVMLNKDFALVGLSEAIVHHLGDIIDIELPTMGELFSAGDTFATLHTRQRGAIELRLPVSGEITSVNELVQEDPSLVQTQPYQHGWLIELILADRAELNDLELAEPNRELAYA
ncbi:MAG: glycine cleavage system protein H [Vampirovibrionales bacterium]